MAKKSARKAGKQRGAGDSNPVADIMAGLSATVQKQIEGLRKSFGDYAATFKLALSKRADLVDPFFRLYGVVTAERPKTTFVQFVAMIDPTVPFTQREDDEKSGAPGYRSHATYQAAEYLRRLKNAQGAAEGRGGAASTRQRRMSPTEKLARLLKTMIQIVRADQLPAFWSGVQTELEVTNKAGLATLQRETEKAEPFLRLPKLSPKQQIPVRVLHVAHGGAAAEEEEETQTRRRA